MAEMTEINDSTLIVDSREKWTQDGSKDRHIAQYFDKRGVNWVVKKLDVGDYILFGGNVSVDRKHDIEEIAKNLTNPKDKERFWNEVRLAYRLKIHLVVLIESNKYHDIYDLRNWKSQFSPTDGNTLIRKMERLSFAYGVQFVFSSYQSTGKKILEILNYDVIREGVEVREREERLRRGNQVESNDD